MAIKKYIWIFAKLVGPGQILLIFARAGPMIFIRAGSGPGLKISSCADLPVERMKSRFDMSRKKNKSDPIRPDSREK